MTKGIRTPLVSVIIPTYNGADFLKCFSIPSVLSQSYKNVEIIVVDDGSIEEAGEVVRGFQKYNKKIQYIKHRENRGLAAALNTGIRESKGEYIAFLEHDDIWLSNKLEEQIYALYQNPAYIFCQTYAWKFDISKGLIVDVFPAVFSAFVFRKAAFHKIGLFDESRELLGIQDGDLDARLKIASANNKLDPLHRKLIVPKPLLIYIKHRGSLSDHYHLTRVEKKYLSILRKYDQPKFRGIPEMRKLLAYWHLHLGYNLLFQKRRYEGLHHLLTSLTLHFGLKVILKALFSPLFSYMPKRTQQFLYREYNELLKFLNKIKVSKYVQRYPLEYRECLEVVSKPCLQRYNRRYEGV